MPNYFFQNIDRSMMFCSKRSFFKSPTWTHFLSFSSTSHSASNTSFSPYFVNAQERKTNGENADPK